MDICSLIFIAQEIASSGAERSTAMLYAGAVDLLDQVGLGIGFPDELRICFPVCYRLLLSVIYFLILEEQKEVRVTDVVFQGMDQAKRLAGWPLQDLLSD